MGYYLYDLKTAEPSYLLRQSDILNWLKDAYLSSATHTKPILPKDENFLRKSVERFSCPENKINTRGTFLADFTHRNWSEMEVYNFENSPSGANIEVRMKIFDRIAGQLFNDLLAKQQAPQNLIHVTCTGYLAPSPAQRFLARQAWHHTTRVTHLYHMGCYAFIPALHTACGFSSLDEAGDPETTIIHTELCSLHVDAARHEPDQIVAQSLFADGAAAYTVSSKKPPKGFEILTTHEELVEATGESMAWNLTPHGMRMSLSKNVPEAIAQNIKGFIARLFEKAKMKWDQRDRDTIYAIHPGGPKIIEQIENILELDHGQTKASHDTLFVRGNMSSGTLPHICQRIIDSENPGKTVVCLAFGPGLTLCGAILRTI